MLRVAPRAGRKGPGTGEGRACSPADSSKLSRDASSSPQYPTSQLRRSARRRGRHNSNSRVSRTVTTKATRDSPAFDQNVAGGVQMSFVVPLPLIHHLVGNFHRAVVAENLRLDHTPVAASQRLDGDVNGSRMERQPPFAIQAFRRILRERRTVRDPP